MEEKMKNKRLEKLGQSIKKMIKTNEDYGQQSASSIP
jgi:hypothetical protein